MKKDNKLIIVIVVLTLLLVGSVGYICYDKFISKDNSADIRKEDDTNSKKEESRDLSHDELSVLALKIDEYNRRLAKYYPIDDMSKISNADLFLFAINGVRKPGDKVFDAVAMKNYVKAFFDDSIELKNEDYHCKVDKKVSYKYDEGTNKYTYVNEGHWHGGSEEAFPSEINTKILDGKYENGIYAINAKVLYGNFCADTCGPVNSYYKSYADAKAGKDAVASNFGEYVSEEQKDAYREKLPVTTYKFKKKDNGNFVLVSVDVK